MSEKWEVVASDNGMYAILDDVRDVGLCFTHDDAKQICDLQAENERLRKFIKWVADMPYPYPCERHEIHDHAKNVLTIRGSE